jgi:hypothetical protein
MAKSTSFSYFLLILCLGAAHLPAQEQSMIAPPIPSVLPPEPPDPDTLPPPPSLEWEALPPRDSEEAGGTSGGIDVPPPQLEAPLAPPPPPVEESPLPGEPDPAEVELAKPEVEIWRESSEWPQVPERRFNRLAQSYVTGTAPVWLRVQFDPEAAGKTVIVKPGRGIILQPPDVVMTIPENGECLVLATLAEGLPRGHVIFYCDGVKTVLPVVRAPLATVIEAEEGTGGGQ